mmetsp:Transcript_105481/g.267982  ORF Transcript_105481/g.267982 Transcript_105481/m.267982 type:complete len:284 (-) Transcript_105481:365-1216(-)
MVLQPWVLRARSLPYLQGFPDQALAEGVRRLHAPAQRRLSYHARRDGPGLQFRDRLGLQPPVVFLLLIGNCLELGRRQGTLRRRGRFELPRRALGAHTLHRGGGRHLLVLGHAVWRLRCGREPHRVARGHGLCPLQGGVESDHHLRQAGQPRSGGNLRCAAVLESDRGAISVQLDLRWRRAGELLQEHHFAVQDGECLRLEVQCHPHNVPRRAEQTRVLVGWLHGVPHVHRIRRTVRRDRSRADDQLDGHLFLHLQFQQGGRRGFQPWRGAGGRHLPHELLRG